MPELGEIFIQITWRGFGRAVLFLKHSLQDTLQDTVVFKQIFSVSSL